MDGALKIKTNIPPEELPSDLPTIKIKIAIVNKKLSIFKKDKLMVLRVNLNLLLNCINWHIGWKVQLYDELQNQNDDKVMLLW